MSDQPERNQHPQQRSFNPPCNQTQLNARQQAANEFINYRFSAEELQVIRQCESEAFFQRCLPFGFGFGLAAYFGVQRGFLKANAKYGAAPKVIGFTIFGYIAGRFSYQKRCQEKMMQLPNSKFAEMLRRNLGKKNNFDKSYDILPDPGAATALSLAPFQSVTDSYSDIYSQPNSLNLDTTRPTYSDDMYKPTMEGSNDLNEDLVIPIRKNTVTYDELRQKNREEYSKNQFNTSRTPPPSQPPQQPPPHYGQPQPEIDNRRANLRARLEDEGKSVQPGPINKNKYGDSWSE